MDAAAQLVDLPSGKFAVWRLGRGAQALVLHGGPGFSSEYTEGLAEELCEDFATIRYQQRGLSPTTAREPYTVETHVADAIAILEALGIEGAWAIGHSWGGHLAMHLAVAHPDRLLGMVVIGGIGALGDGGMVALNAEIRARMTPERAARAKELGGWSQREDDHDAMEWLRLAWPSYFAHPDQAPRCPLRVSVPCLRKTFASVRDHLARGTLELGLPSFRSTAMFIHGKQDPIPFESLVATAALVPGATVTLFNDCGHFPWWERPGETAKAIRASLPV